MEATHVDIVGGHVKLGKLEKKDDERTLRLARYTTKLEPPPISVDYATATERVLGRTTWGMMANDRLGDCSCAALGHAEQTWEAIGHGKKFTPTNRAVEALYWATGTEDNGRYLLDVLNYVHNKGIFRHKLHAFAEINLTDMDDVRNAIYLFGCAYIGLALPKSAQTQKLWDIVNTPDGNPGTWGGHCVEVVAYDPSYLECITWGIRTKMTWSFFHRYCDEGYALISQSWLTKNKSPQGFAMGQLNSDLSDVAS